MVFLLVLALCGALAGGASAKPTVKEKWTTYRVDATTADMLVKQLHQRGPNGYWAYTTWYVKWTGDCKVSLEVSYTMPKHANPSALPADVRSRWDGMVAALAAHERKHGQHGVNAANEIVAAGCRNGNAIIDKWANQDKVLDRRTDHGKKEGVIFP